MGEQQEVKWIGGVSARQDVTIRLVQKRASEETLAVVKVHSRVLFTHSKYFKTCLSERWSSLKSSQESSCTLNFVLEAQADVDSYFHCFARMYAPHLKNDRYFDVKHSLELLKVASQIEFDELMKSTARALSSAFWSKEDEIKIREYSSSPDFPRNHAKDLTARLGLDIPTKSELEHLQERSWLVITQIVCTAVNTESDDSDVRSARAFVAELLQSLNGPAVPYNFANKVIKLFNSEAKTMLVSIGRSCEEEKFVSENEVVAICWALKALLSAKLAEELVPVFVHLNAIPKTLYEEYASHIHFSSGISNFYSAPTWAQKLAEVVLLMYEEVVAGRLVLTTADRVSLLTNWHPFLKFNNYFAPAKHVIEDGEPEMKLETKLNLATRQLFSTLPFKEQVECINSPKNYDDFIDNYTSFISKLSESLANLGIGSSGNIDLSSN